jgi:hypothetical protein
MTTDIKKLRLMGRSLGHVKGLGLGNVDGVGSYGPTEKATLYVGLKTGIDQANTPTGAPVHADSVEDAVFALRTRQVGVKDASQTTTIAQGKYRGSSEPSLKIDLVHTFPDRETSREAFETNVRTLAEELAGEFAQREILIEWTKPVDVKEKSRGKNKTKTVTRIETETASPTGAPAPTEEKFCEWVRSRSANARTNPKDACYAPSALEGAKRRKK